MKKEQDGYQVEAEVGKGCKVAVTVTVAPEHVQKAYKQAVKRINKEISLPGFRKGKAPDEVVIQRYEAPIEKEWKELVVNDAFQAVMKLTGIYPYNKNTIDKPKIGRCSQEEGAVVTISYECYPQVPEIDFKAITLPKLKRREIKQEEVDAIVNEVRQANAGWEEVSGQERPKEGDYVDLSIDKIDEEPPRSLVERRRFEISPVMVGWLKALLLGGLKVGESVEGETSPDERASEEEKKSFQPIKVKVTLHNIQKILLPEVDDELAKKTGAPDKEELFKRIRSNLEKDAENKLKEEKIQALENQLVEKFNFELPASVVRGEVEARVNDRIEELTKQGLSPEKIEEERKEIERSALENAGKGLRLHFLLAEIGERGNVHLSQAELNEKLNNEILRNPYYHGMVKENSPHLQTLIRRLTTHFQHEKIREYALAQVERS